MTRHDYIHSPNMRLAHHGSKHDIHGAVNLLVPTAVTSCGPIIQLCKTCEHTSCIPVCADCAGVQVIFLAKSRVV